MRCRGRDVLLADRREGHASQREHHLAPLEADERIRSYARLSPMEIHREGALVLVEVELVAPVPIGHDVLVLDLKLEGAFWPLTSTAQAVVDETTGTVFADENYWLALKEKGWPPLPPAADPVGSLGARWRVKRSVRGRVRGSVVSTKDEGDHNHARTLLYVAPPEAEGSYRG
jgi:hypothetical protein